MDRAQSDRLGSAFNLSVYWMLAVPGLMIAGLATLIAVNVRARVRLEAQSTHDRQ